MPYLTLQTVDGHPVEIGGNTEADFKAAITKNGKIAAVDAAHALIAIFFQRRKVVLDRQKALQAGKEDLADELEDKIGELEDKETKAKEAYTKAAARGAASNTPAAGSSGAGDSSAAGAPSKGSTTSAYGAAFDKAAAHAAPVSEDDFI